MSISAYQPLQIYVIFGGEITKPQKKNGQKSFCDFYHNKNHKSGEVDRQICSSPKSGEVDRHFCPSYSSWTDLPLLRISLYCSTLLDLQCMDCNFGNAMNCTALYYISMIFTEQHFTALHCTSFTALSRTTL